MTLRTRIAVILAASSFAGCSSTLPPGSSTTFAQSQQAAAEAAEARGDLAAALVYWRTLQALSPGDRAVDARVGALEADIDARLLQALERGTAAYARGDRRAGDRSMVQALALRPGLEEALVPLRQSASLASHERQAEKVASEFTERAVAEEDSALAALQAAYGAGDLERAVVLGESEALNGSGAARDVTREAYLGLADRAHRDGDSEEELRHLVAAIALSGGDDADLLARERALRDGLSSEAYREGLALIQTDVPAAIAQFERAVSYDPGNLAAREKLEQARKIKANLDRIRGG